MSQEDIQKGLHTVCNMDKTGFRDHNYLWRVLVNQGAEKLSAEGLTAREEEGREVRRRSGGSLFDHKTTEVEKHKEQGYLSAEEVRKRAGEFAAKVGKRM